MSEEDTPYIGMDEDEEDAEEGSNYRVLDLEEEQQKVLRRLFPLPPPPLQTKCTCNAMSSSRPGMRERRW